MFLYPQGFSRTAPADLFDLSGQQQNRQAPWWSQTGSNRRPHACKARALPTELWPLWVAAARVMKMVGLGRLERPTSPLSGVRSNHLSYRPETQAAGKAARVKT